MDASSSSSAVAVVTLHTRTLLRKRVRDVQDNVDDEYDMDEDTFNGERMDESIQGSTNGQRHQPQERPQLQQHAQTPQEVAVPTYDMDIGETPSTSYYMLQANA